MTKFKKTLVLSAMTVATLATAGTLTVNGGINSASLELLEAGPLDVNLTKSMTFVKTAGAASVTDAGFELKFPGLTIKNAADIQICNEANTSVAVFDRVDVLADGDSIIFATVSGGTVERNTDYKIIRSAAAGSATTDDLQCAQANEQNIDIGDLELTLPQNTTSANGKMILTSNTGGDLDNATAAILETKTQYSASVTTKFDAMIDAADGFLTFTGSATTDSAAITYTDLKSDLDFAAATTAVVGNIVPDQNLSTYTASPTGWAFNSADFNVTEPTLAPLDTNGSTTNTLTLTVDGEIIPETAFTSYVDITFNGFDKRILAAADTGKWEIYGYNAKIPAASASANTATVVTVVNTGTSTSAEAYITLIDSANNTCTLDSATHASVPKPIPGGAHKYKLADMLAEADCSALTGTGYAIEISIPTTPSDFYAGAQVSNTSLGATKSIPVYNNSTSF